MRYPTSVTQSNLMVSSQGSRDWEGPQEVSSPTSYTQQIVSDLSFSLCQLSLILLPCAISSVILRASVRSIPALSHFCFRLNKSACPSCSSRGQCSSPTTSLACNGFHPIYVSSLGEITLNVVSRCYLTSSE